MQDLESLLSATSEKTALAGGAVPGAERGMMAGWRMASTIFVRIFFSFLLPMTILLIKAIFRKYFSFLKGIFKICFSIGVDIHYYGIFISGVRHSG